MGERPNFSDVELQTPRLVLRPWRPSDAPTAFRALQLPAMREFLLLPDPYTIDDATAYATTIGNAGRADGTALGCAMVERSSGRLVGSADLRFSTSKLLGADIGYAVYPDAQGNGYAAEATRALVDWGQAQGLNRIELRCAVTNLASAATALAAGFRFEGVNRALLHGDTGGDRDAACFSRLRDDDGAAVPPTFPRIDGTHDEVVGLRILRPEDIEAYCEQEADPVTVEMALNPEPRPRAAVATLCNRGGLDRLVGPVAQMAIVEHASDQFLGSMQLRLSGPPGVGSIGYAVHPEHRGRGHATRALRLLVQWAFGTAGLARLELGAKLGNLASQRVALGAGFEPDGVRAARLRNGDDSYADEARFALLNPQTARLNPQTARLNPQTARRINP